MQTRPVCSWRWFWSWIYALYYEVLCSKILYLSLKHIYKGLLIAVSIQCLQTQTNLLSNADQQLTKWRADSSEAESFCFEGTRETCMYCCSSGCKQTLHKTTNVNRDEGNNDESHVAVTEGEIPLSKNRISYESGNLISFYSSCHFNWTHQLITCRTD